MNPPEHEPGSVSIGFSALRSRRMPVCAGLCGLLIACAGTAPNPERYRLADSGAHWDVAGSDRVFDDVRPRYPDFFEVILDVATTGMPDTLRIRDDLEHTPVDRRNYDALNAIAIAYYETNHRGEAKRGEGLAYLALGQRSAKLLAIPWRAYGETENDALRDAILDFFEDAGTGGKLFTEQTAPRLVRIVESLEKKETDETRSERIRELAQTLRSVSPTEP